MASNQVKCIKGHPASGVKKMRRRTAESLRQVSAALLSGCENRSFWHMAEEGLDRYRLRFYITHGVSRGRH